MKHARQLVLQISCCLCHYVWTEPEKEGEKTMKAAKVNGDGPFCNACRTGIEFIRYARARGDDPGILLKVLVKRERKL